MESHIIFNLSKTPLSCCRSDFDLPYNFIPPSFLSIFFRNFPFEHMCVAFGNELSEMGAHIDLLNGCASVFRTHSSRLMTLGAEKSK
jgi:hypothetical protein